MGISVAEETSREPPLLLSALSSMKPSLNDFALQHYVYLAWYL
jgi:hypothetical protein